MKVKDVNASMDFNGDILLAFRLDKSNNSIVEEILQIDKADIPKYDLTFLKRRKKRSLDANAYAWVLIGKLGAKLNKSDLEIYREYIRDNGVFEILPIREDAIERWLQFWEARGLGWICEDLGECKNIKGYHYIKSYYGSSTYNSKEMARLIDAIVQDCKEQGIEVLTPKEVERLKAMWGRKQDESEM